MTDYSNWKETEIQLSSILLDEINPRVIINGERTQERMINYLIEHFDVIGLANDINESHGLVPAEKIVCIKKDNYYIVVEGNRRITACKILSNPSLIPNKHKNKLNTPNQETLTNINKIKICLAPSRDEAEPYITLRHSDYGIKKWSTLAQIQRVMQRYNLGIKPSEISKLLGIKTSEVKKSIKFYNFLEYIKNKLNWTEQELEIISNPLLETTKLDRFLPFSSKAKSILHIDFDKSYNLITDIKEANFKKALKIIISNIYIHEKYNTRTSLEDVFNDEIAKLCEEKDNSSDNKENIKNESTLSVSSNNNTSDEQTNNDNHNNIDLNKKNTLGNSYIKTNATNQDEDNLKNNNNPKTANYSNNNADDVSRSDNEQKPKNKRNPKPANFFDNLNWTALNNQNKFENGIINLCSELKKLSKTKNYKEYPISTAILIRSLLELSLEYYVIKTENHLFIKRIIRSKLNEPIIYKKLEQILSEYSIWADNSGQNTSLFYKNDTLARTFKSFAANTGTKDFFDMIIHHPENVKANYNILEIIADSGLASFLNEVLN